jgi:hypothetical protein
MSKTENEYYSEENMNHLRSILDEVYVRKHANHLQSILDQGVLSKLKKHCNGDESEMLLITKESVEKVMQKTKGTGGKVIYKELTPAEKNEVLDVPMYDSDHIESILGLETFDLLKRYCLWNEEVMITIINKAVTAELNTEENKSND